MSAQFKAIVLNQEGENFSREVKYLDKSFFKHGDVADLAEKMTKFLLDKNKEVRRDQAIARIEATYTPEAQVAFITSALKNKLEGKC